MEKNLYDYMDWPNIEAVMYAEMDFPQKVLGARKRDGKVLVTCFFPDAKEVYVVLESGKGRFPMEEVDENGFFAVFLPRKRIPQYHYEVGYEQGTVIEQEVYTTKSQFTNSDLIRFANGTHYQIYEKLGAHRQTIDGRDGVLFAVWAPNAISVSVVGDFNFWDGRRHLMKRLADSGIFELFIPSLSEGDLYKYEVHQKGGKVVLKSDPYGNYSEKRPNNASIICDLSHFEWQDAPWMEKRKKWNMEKEPVSVYELHLGSFQKNGEEFYNYRELAPMVAEYCKEMGFTHAELMPIMEHPFDGSWGYQVTGYYAPTSRYGTPRDFMYFIDYMHQEGIGVILDWVPAHFPKDENGLARFDGTCLYEHLDPRQGEHPHWGTLIYNYGRPQVSNFLVANALFWLEKFHVDGLRLDAVASMLYLDYGKQDGEWVANMYGGHENLEAIDLLKTLNSVVKKRKDGCMMIAEESTAWSMVTGKLEDGGLGFDLKWNMGWMNDYLEYIRTDPLFRKDRHGMLTFSMVYQYSEQFMLVFSHDEVVHEKGSMYTKMPGGKEEKLAGLRLTYGYMICHPGKKLLFMGQEFGQKTEWNENKALCWEQAKEKGHAELKHFTACLNLFYQKHPALYLHDGETKGFEWISELDADHSVIAFLRKSTKETLLIVCNFTPVAYEKFVLGVPFEGKYKEILNSDAEEYGGTGLLNPRIKNSRPLKQDGRKHSIEFRLPGLGITIFQCTRKER